MTTGYKVQKYRVRLVKDGRAAVLPTSRVANEQAAVDIFRSVLSGLPHEEVWIALLNAKNDAQGLVRVSQGGLHGAALKPVDVLRPVIAAGVGAFIMAHNHPSGDPTPSQADVEMTSLLIRASETVGLTLLDHLILTDGGQYMSLRYSDALGSVDWA